MTDLLSRLSAATGPSRELDAEIALANGWMRSPHRLAITDLLLDTTGHHQPAPRYTESIDAAITILGDDLTIVTLDYVAATAIVTIGKGFSYHAEAQTANNALVIACLKARMEKDNAGQ